MNTTRHNARTLNGLLQGELAAIDTYQQALAKVDGGPRATELRQLHADHCDAAYMLQSQIRESGGEPASTAGLWGSFAKAVEGTAKLLGKKAALRALQEGEKHGIRIYLEALAEPDLSPNGRELIAARLLPGTRAHIPVLDNLMTVV